MLSDSLFSTVQFCLRMNLTVNSSWQFPIKFFKQFFKNEFHELFTKHKLAKVFGVNEEKEEIVGWIN